MNIFELIHGNYVFKRRVHVLSQHLAKLIPDNASVLDVGCGNGLITHLISWQRPELKSQGIDVLIREKTYIPVTQFDGKTIPYEDASFDVVMFVDVLHHTEEPMILLREAKRVARQAIVLKDHTCNGLLAHTTLRFMDQVGNERYGVVLPYNYLTEDQWFDACDTLGLKISNWTKQLGLYPLPLNWLFERSLHFIAKLTLS